jgi:quinol monooxygenase YgiN
MTTLSTRSVTTLLLFAGPWSKITQHLNVELNGAIAMIHVVAVITAHPGQRAKILEALAANRAAVLAEDGCIEYTAVTDAASLPPSPGSLGADTLVVIEKWASLAALQAHGKSAHMAAYSAKTREFTAKRMIHILEPV